MSIANSIRAQIPLFTRRLSFIGGFAAGEPVLFLLWAPWVDRHRADDLVRAVLSAIPFDVTRSARLVWSGDGRVSMIAQVLPRPTRPRRPPLTRISCH